MNRFLGSYALVVLAAACNGVPQNAPPAAEARPSPLIVQAPDENVRVTLAGNTRPEAKPENDRGPVSDDLVLDHMLLQLRRSPEVERSVQQLIDGLHTRGSPSYHQWLAPDELGSRFGVADQDLAAVTSWLSAHGFSVEPVAPGRMVIDFSGTAGQVREAFRTELHVIEAKGEQHIANMRDPSIPFALSPVIEGIVSLHDFRPHHPHTPKPDYSFTSGGYTYQSMVPADLATIYNLNPLFAAGVSGQGETIAVIEDTNLYNTSDWTTFRSTFGLSSYAGTFATVHPAPAKGGTACTNPGVNSDDDEATLDAEWASASAPSAAIELASCKDTKTTFGGLIAIQNLVNGTSRPSVISMSYGECEAENGAAANAAYASAYQQAVAEGIAVFVSAGDEGAASCDADENNATHGIGVSGFASTPYNVAVGGTDFGDTVAHTNNTYWSATNSATYESALSYVPEIPWNDSCASGLLASFFGYSTTYGTKGFCSSDTAKNDGYVTVTSGSGGPSGCATGTPSASGVVGGSCAGYAKPAWQSILGNPSDGVRDIPDVSLFAANGVWGHYYVYCFSDTSNGGAACTGAPSNWAGGGGTSFSTPIMAGIQALVNQQWGAQGNPNYVYYALASGEYGTSGSAACNSTSGNATAASCTFYDVTQGDMDVNCTGDYDCYDPSGKRGVLSTSSSADAPAYGTSGGWDFATGIGTVNAYNLVTSSAW